MGNVIEWLVAVWMLLVGWMPPVLASACTLALIILFIFMLIKLIGFILSAIPFF